MTAARPRLALLDRDGVINVDVGYLHDPDELVFAPGAIAGMRLLRDLGYRLVVVTNQSGIGREYFDERTFLELTSTIRDRLLALDITIAATYHCPHLPDAACACRKPMPGMLRQAMRDFGADANDTIMIGDKASDIAAGDAAGVRRSYRIGPVGNGSDHFSDLYACARHIAANEPPHSR